MPQLRGVCPRPRLDRRRRSLLQPTGGTIRWRSFVSPGTIVSGALAILVWGLIWNWAAAIMLVLLLYVHELGHVLAALWRGVAVQRAPLFLPGFGAVVLVEPAERPWDEVLVSLGGPIFGAAIALVARLAGNAWGLPALVSAGDLGFWLNLANLLPFRPLDGGQVVARTGWLGFIPAALLGVALLALNLTLRSGLLLSVIIVIGLVWGYHTVRQDRAVELRTRLSIIGLYTLTVAALLGTYALSAVPSLLQRAATLTINLPLLPTLSATVPSLSQRSATATPPPRSVPGPGVFNGPAGIAVDGQGNLYVADTYNDRIQKLAPDGRSLAQWGVGGREPGQFDTPVGVALDGAGQLYVADLGNGRIQKLSTQGEPLAAWGWLGEGEDEFSLPSGIAVDRHGFIYVTDLGSGRLQKLSPTGQPLASRELAEGDPERLADFWGLLGVALDQHGNLYVADPTGPRVTKFSPDGGLLRYFDLGGGVEATQPYGIAVDQQGNLYVTDGSGGRLVKLSPEGEPIAEWAAPAPGRDPDMQGVAVDDRGNLYVAGWGSDRVGKLSPAGQQLALWGADERGRAGPRAAGATRGSGALALPAGARWWLEGLPLGILAVFLLDVLAWRYAMQPGRGAAGRYRTLALAGWPRVLVVLRDPWWVAFTACLAAHTLGLPGLRWLEALVRRLAARRNPAAGVGCAMAYDCLQQQGRAAEEWLERLTPALRAAGPDTVDRTFGCLLMLGHRRGPYGWLIRTLAEARTEELSWLAANNLAYSLALAGRHADGLPFARTALAEQPDSSHAHGTLGEILLGVGELHDAEEHLRESLRLQEQPINRLALARTLAAQGRHAEAVAEAEQGLRAHTGPWLDDEPGPDVVRTWLAEWRATSDGAAPAHPPRDDVELTPVPGGA